MARLVSLLQKGLTEVTRLDNQLCVPPLGLKMRPVDELGAAIEGDGSAGMPGQGRERLGDLHHDRLGAFLLVLQRDPEAAGALDHGGDIGGAVFLPEQL